MKTIELYRCGIMLPQTAALDLRSKTTIAVSGACIAQGTLIINFDDSRAPIKVQIRDNTAQLPRVDIVAGNTVRLICDIDDGGKTQRWGSPPFCVDRAGILRLTEDDCLYGLLVTVLSHNDELDTRLSTLEAAIADRNKRSKHPKIGGAKI